HLPEGADQTAARMGRSRLQRAALDHDAQRRPLRGDGGAEGPGRGRARLLPPAALSTAVPADWGHAEPYEDIGSELAIAGVGEADHTRASGRTPREIAVQAVARALDDAGLEPRDVDGLMYNTFDGQQLTAADFHAHFGTAHDLWVSSAGGGMVWAGSAPYEAAHALRAGKARVIVNVFSVAWATQRADMVGGPGEVH